MTRQIAPSPASSSVSVQCASSFSRGMSAIEQDVLRQQDRSATPVETSWGTVRRASAAASPFKSDKPAPDRVRGTRKKRLPCPVDSRKDHAVSVPGKPLIPVVDNVVAVLKAYSVRSRDVQVLLSLYPLRYRAHVFKRHGDRVSTGEPHDQCNVRTMSPAGQRERSVRFDPHPCNCMQPPPPLP